MPARREDARRRERRERERADVEEHVLEAGTAGAPLDGGDRHRERQGDPRPEERRTGERADGADGDRAGLLHLERERLADADEPDDGDQADDVRRLAEHGAQNPGGRTEGADEADEERQGARHGEEPRCGRRVRASGLAAFDLQTLGAKGSLFVTRPSLNHHIITRAELLQRSDELLGWIGNGKLKLRTEHEFPLKDAADAHRALEGRKTTGKVLLIP